ncbi:hypothetical protein DACRYDRAFT_87475 [Dacryopinax primogenitus]|uniref:C2H2-type domain-containing protein n=1 Tax=Dacryopinax primogenitus (strain DJM 731) TaxID=1858805 RepID=M5G696_DACPD|nr:uncharacterized protein DACRYDRAFT_87475 [Dacryopinax primogenitus]EJU04209.1 hypothetical protein DACRYDRAFT_87475 [Dacryopinax primogenitus]
MPQRTQDMVRAEALAKRKYVCSQCDKAFTTSGHLRRHIKVHTGDKPFICPYPKCYKKCNRDDNLVQHFQVHLPKEDRKRGQIYIRDAIIAMRQATDVSSAVLLLAGLPLPIAPASDIESGGDLERGEESAQSSVYVTAGQVLSVGIPSPDSLNEKRGHEDSMFFFAHEAFFIQLTMQMNLHLESAVELTHYHW